LARFARSDHALNQQLWIAPAGEEIREHFARTLGADAGI
jgi:hypothetical protein